MIVVAAFTHESHPPPFISLAFATHLSRSPFAAAIASSIALARAEATRLVLEWEWAHAQWTIRAVLHIPLSAHRQQCERHRLDTLGPLLLQYRREGSRYTHGVSFHSWIQAATDGCLTDSAPSQPVFGSICESHQSRSRVLPFTS
jgi:hypothetical protein